MDTTRASRARIKEVRMLLISGRNCLSYLVIFDHHGVMYARRERAMRWYSSFERTWELGERRRGGWLFWDRFGKRRRDERVSGCFVDDIERVEEVIAWRG